MKCEVCGTHEGTRVVIGVKMCERCYSMFVGLREKDEKSIEFFGNKFNLLKATATARNLINSYIPKDYKASATPVVQSTEPVEAFAPKDETEKTAYKVAAFVEDASTQTDTGKLEAILNENNASGKDLKFVYSRNLSTGQTETVCIFK